jgi:hypothetical protein
MNADRFKYKEITDIVLRSFVTARVGRPAGGSQV